jgi:phosphoglycerol transferase MdoB-like AlkP superfamily enzyme
LALWILPPAVLRLLVFCNLAAYRNFWDALADGGRGMIAGLAQDTLVALEALLLFIVLRSLAERLWPGRWVKGLALACVVLFVGAQIYLVFDFELYRKTGVRVDPSFWEFLPVVTAFSASAWQLGVAGLAFGVVAILGLAPRVFAWLKQDLPGLQFTRPMLWALPVLTLVATLARQGVAAQTTYAMDNLLIEDQVRWLASIARSETLGLVGDESAARRLLAPKAERWQPVAADYPLLKRTEGFFGPKQFELPIAEGERPHVVLLFMESFRAADVGVLGGRFKASPNFDRLAREGVLFRNFYGAGVQTSRAVIASLFSIVPPLFEASPQTSGVPLIGIADLFNRRGYTSAYISGTSLRFEHQGTFFPAHGYAEVYGDQHIARAFPKANRCCWGYHDEYVLDFAADWLATKDRAGKPCLLTLFTISNHHPWEIPDHFRAPEFPDAPHQQYREFLQTFYYSDHCLGRFMDRMRQLGLDRRTVFVVLADHGTPEGEHHGNFMLVNYLYEENVRIPCLILAPGRLVKPTVIDDVGSEVDLMPTLMDLFGMTGLNHSIGTSLVRKVADRTAYFNNPFVLQFLGLRRGNFKYTYTIRSRSSSLYDVLSDPGETRDLASQFPQLCAEYRAEVEAVNLFMRKLYVTGRLAERQE